MKSETTRLHGHRQCGSKTAERRIKTHQLDKNCASEGQTGATERLRDYEIDLSKAMRGRKRGVGNRNQVNTDVATRNGEGGAEGEHAIARASDLQRSAEFEFCVREPLTGGRSRSLSFLFRSRIILLCSLSSH